MAKFNERLRALRQGDGLSQQEFAKQIGLSKSSINMYERGEREPGLETLEAIADYFNVDMDYLLGKSDIRNKTQWLEQRIVRGDKMKLISTFHDRLREAMGDMTATELAHTLGISKQSVSAYVNGTRKPKRIVAGEIARVLNVNPAWLIGYDVSRYPDVRKEHLGIGDGETRSPTPEDILDEFCRIYDLSDRDRSLLKEYLKLTPAERQVILNLMKTPSELD